ncbi:hypothetical protein DdX_18269 [Ditylenchus destructor]|uniref:Protein kinase domain-containing protein n=1 Tax=Ditylenchus destructor TaxID=166010 RepID=A0AAD4QSX9_9BILA|nr:hypothetical protein DdX_18269 [Ditylenchus destructor]
MLLLEDVPRATIAAPNGISVVFNCGIQQIEVQEEFIIPIYVWHKKFVFPDSMGYKICVNTKHKWNEQAFEILAEVGRSGHGEVKKAKRKEGNIVTALKFLTISADNVLNDIEREIINQAAASNIPFVLRYRNWWITGQFGNSVRDTGASTMVQIRDRPYHYIGPGGTAFDRKDVDVYTLGVVMFDMLSKKRYSSGYLGGEEKDPDWKSVPEEGARDLVMAMLKHDHFQPVQQPCTIETVIAKLGVQWPNNLVIFYDQR